LRHHDDDAALATALGFFMSILARNVCWVLMLGYRGARNLKNSSVDTPAVEMAPHALLLPPLPLL
jgi:hypothetical protein